MKWFRRMTGSYLPVGPCTCDRRTRGYSHNWNPECPLHYCRCGDLDAPVFHAHPPKGKYDYDKLMACNDDDCCLHG